VRVEGDVVPGRCIDHALGVVDHVLALVPAVVDLAIAADHPGLAGIGDIACLDRFDAQFLVQRKGRFHLAFIVRRVGRGLVVADQADAPGPGVGGEPDQVVVRIRPAEIEVLAIAEPVAAPAQVPAFHQHAPEVMAGGKIDVAHRIGGGRAMGRAELPGLLAQVHLPPDPDVLHRPDPGHIAQRVGLVEVEDQVGLDQIAGALADLDGAPWGVERRTALDLGEAAAARGQCGPEPAALAAGEVHARIIHQRRFVDGQVQAIGGAQGDRRLRLATCSSGVRW